MDAIFGFFVGLFAFFIPGLAPQTQYYGYVEAEYLYIAPEGAGRITQLAVNEGDAVIVGQLLFALDDAGQVAGLRGAAAREAVAAANWQNLKTGSRQAEVDVIAASLQKAEADLELAQATLTRDTELLAKGFASQALLDADQAKFANAEAQVSQLKAQLDVAHLPARDAQLVSAEKNLEAAEADRQRAQSDLDARTVLAPAAARVDRLYFRAGEVVGTGVPVLSLLPPSVLKARFFVPEVVRSTLHIGDRMQVTCDGCTKPFEAVLTYMASDPQHTPPIIYSLDERARLVFMAEARLEEDAQLLPGQPIGIGLAK